MIRNGNYFIPIRKRTQTAQKKRANLLISIHTNSTNNKKISGISVWIFSNTKKHILNKNKLKKYNNINKIKYELAKTVIKELHNVTNLNQTQPKFARFAILNSTSFPSILIETGFISNPKEAKNLNSQYYQNLIVKYIFLALQKYFLKY